MHSTIRARSPSRRVTNPSRTRFTISAFAAMGALVGIVMALSGAGDAPAAAALHGGTLGMLAGAMVGSSLFLLLLYDADRLFRR